MAIATSEIFDVAQPDENPACERFVYDDAIVRAFLSATVFWGVAAFLIGLFLAVELVLPALKFNTRYFAFGRLRPVHTNAAIFAFAGNAIFAAIYHSTQRLCKARMFSNALSRIHFWGWQAIIVSAAVTLPLGFTTGTKFAEVEWPISLAIALVWITFAVNFFGTLARRRERYLYVSLWFYIATAVTVPILLIVQCAQLPVSAWKSYSAFAGVQDAFMQSWYGHNLLGFMLIMPFVGIMYYYLPKAVDRPVYSYWLSVVQFWSLMLLYVWAGPQQLRFTPAPEWAPSLGMLFSLLLLMPLWGGMINGLLTLRGAWARVADDPVLKFFAVALTFYGIATFEECVLAIAQVDALGHYTDWYVAHMHTFGLGWVGFMTFGMLYYLMPRMFQAPVWSKRMMNAHFWLATIAILLYVVPIYIAGLTQALMWRATFAHGPNQGQLMYPTFIEALSAVRPMYWLRAGGGSLYLLGTILCGFNFIMTWRASPARYEMSAHEAPPLEANFIDAERPKSRVQGAPVLEFAHDFDIWLQGWWHRIVEGRPLKFTLWVVLAVAVASACEIAPIMLFRSGPIPISPIQTNQNQAKSATAATATPTAPKPYTPLELLGRDIYVANGCCNCHSQMIRPILAETKRYGEYSKLNDSVYDHPVQWGSRRTGPDLAREGMDRTPGWHAMHLHDPQLVTSGSVMPDYKWMFETKVSFDSIPRRMNAMRTLGVPYSSEEIAGSVDSARKQAEVIAKAIETEYPIADLSDKEVVALIAYLNRLGREPIAPSLPAASKSAEAEKQATLKVNQAPVNQ